MKVSKEDAEKYLNAFKALESACGSILPSCFEELEEFGDIKVGDIYIDLNRKIYYPEHPQRWYFQVGRIYWTYPGNLRSISQVLIRFNSLDSEEMSFTEKYVQELESFKKISYLRGKCSFLFGEDKCKFAVRGHHKNKQGEFKVVGFLIDEPLILISPMNKSDRIFLAYPSEISGLNVK